MNFERLPVETIARIFAFLDYNDLLVVARLNRFFRDVYQTFPELQYSIALQVSGLVDSNRSLDIRYKLEELERRERAWRTLDLSRKVTVKVPHNTSHIYDLSGGVYLLGDCKGSLLSRQTHSLRFFDFSSCTSGQKIREEPWPEMKVDLNIVDIGLGLNEFDLVAVVGIKPGHDGGQDSIILSLRERSTGAPHPLARNPDIIVDPVKEDHGKLSIMLEVVGPRLLLLLTWERGLQRVLRHEHDKLLLFNWWDGTKVITESAPQSTWDGFVFLSPELVLLPDRDRGIEIIRLPDVTKGYSAKGFERVLRLSLPSLQPLCKIGTIQCRAEPNPSGTPHPSMFEGTSEFAMRMRARNRPPVAPDPMKTVVLLQIYYREFNNEPNDILMGHWGVLRHNVSLIVHRELLLQLVDMFANKEQRASDSGDADTLVSTVPMVPWAQWGTRARWMADDTHVSNWITTSAGQRYIGTDEEGHIIVKDFNPHTVRRARAVSAAAASSDGDFMNVSDSLTDNRFRSFSDDGSESTSDSDSERQQEPRLRPSVDKTDSQLTEETDEINPIPVPNLDKVDNASWRSVRVVEEYNEIEDTELRQLFSEGCKLSLPCVEYVSRKTYEYHGLLLDEERIIGLRHDEQTGAIVEFDVFTL